MIDRYWLAALVLASTTTLGCGLIQSNLPTIQTVQSLRPGAVSRTYDAPLTRLVDAVTQANRAEINLDLDNLSAIEIQVKESSLARNSPKTPVGTFSMEVTEDDLEIASGSITGKTTDDRPATVWFRSRDHEKMSEITVFIGKHGDLELSKTYLDRVAYCLAHPVALTPEQVESRKKRMHIAIDSAIKNAPLARKDETPPPAIANPERP